ncbi:hypothetical protein LY78DRAFT_662145 [Colletotrichum sublineola]|nr:hypothetical protein LY78DRAFT_662145 [Colletotrichum sublineola]
MDGLLLVCLASAALYPPPLFTVNKTGLGKREQGTFASPWFSPTNFGALSSRSPSPTEFEVKNPLTSGSGFFFSVFFFSFPLAIVVAFGAFGLRPGDGDVVISQDAFGSDVLLC